MCKNETKESWNRYRNIIVLQVNHYLYFVAVIVWSCKLARKQLV